MTHEFKVAIFEGNQGGFWLDNLGYFWGKEGWLPVHVVEVHNVPGRYVALLRRDKKRENGE